MNFLRIHHRGLGHLACLSGLGRRIVGVLLFALGVLAAQAVSGAPGASQLVLTEHGPALVKTGSPAPAPRAAPVVSGRSALPVSLARVEVGRVFEGEGGGAFFKMSGPASKPGAKAKPAAGEADGQANGKVNGQAGEEGEQPPPSLRAEPVIPPAAPGALGLARLIMLALDTHPSVVGKRLEEEAAGSLVKAARLQFYPTPSVSVDSFQGHQATVFRLTQPLWTGGRLTADLSAAELRRLRAGMAVSDAELTLALRVVTLYQSFLMQSGRIESQRRGIEKLDSLVKMIERRSSTGVSAQVDLDLARSRLSQARGDMIALAASRRTTLSQLAQTVGQPLRAEDVAIDLMPVEPGGISNEPGADELPLLRDRAIANSPGLRLADIDAQISRVEIEQTRALLWPTVSLRAEHQEGAYAGTLPPGGRIYLSVQYTPGAGASVIPQAAAAEVKAQAAEQLIQTTRREVGDRVDAEWQDMRSAEARIPELERTRAGASDVLDSSFRLFVAGRRTWLDLLNSVRELMQNEQIEADARATAVGASYRLSLLAGEARWSRQGEVRQDRGGRNE